MNTEEKKKKKKGVEQPLEMRLNEAALWIQPNQTFSCTI